MKEFFEVLEEHADAAISIAFFVYMLNELAATQNDEMVFRI